MQTIKKRLSVNIGQFETFDPANVLLANARTGSIPTETGTLVLKEVMGSLAVMQLAKYEQMNTLKKTFTYLADGPGAYWVGEAERIQTSKATWLEASMEAKKLGVIIPVSKEFLKFTVTDFFNQVRPMIAEAFYKKFDQAALFGNGSPYATGVSVWERIASSGQTVEEGTNANLYLDFNDVIALLEDGDHDFNGLTTTKSFRKNLRGAVDQNNLPIFNDATGNVAAQVLGQPIAYAPKASFDTTKALALAGDWDMARYGILQNIEYAVSEDATLTTIVDDEGNPVNLFERDMFALRATMHIGFMTLKDDAFAALVPSTVVGG